MLARFIAGEFGRLNERMDHMDERFDGIDGRLNGIDGRLNGIEERLDRVESDVGFIKNELRETNQRLSSLEQKQFGTLESLDNTVPRHEFEKLEERVVILETKTA